MLIVTAVGLLRRDEANAARLKFAVGNSDHLTLLRAYQAWVGI